MKWGTHSQLGLTRGMLVSIPPLNTSLFSSPLLMGFLTLSHASGLGRRGPEPSFRVRIYDARFEWGIGLVWDEPGDGRVLLAEAGEMRRNVTVSRFRLVLVLGLAVSRVTEYRLTCLVCWKCRPRKKKRTFAVATSLADPWPETMNWTWRKG
jgi:hypothetical protein